MPAIRKLLFLLCLALGGCGERDTHDPPSFASADLPRIGGGENPATQLWINITSDGRVTVNGTTYSSAADFFPMAQAAVREDPSLRAWIQAEPAVTYAALMAVIDVLKQATISRMAFDYSSSATP